MMLFLAAHDSRRLAVTAGHPWSKIQEQALPIPAHLNLMRGTNVTVETSLATNSKEGQPNSIASGLKHDHDVNLTLEEQEQEYIIALPQLQLV